MLPVSATRLVRRKDPAEAESLLREEVDRLRESLGMGADGTTAITSFVDGNKARGGYRRCLRSDACTSATTYDGSSSARDGTSHRPSRCAQRLQQHRDTLPLQKYGTSFPHRGNAASRARVSLLWSLAYCPALCASSSTGAVDTATTEQAPPTKLAVRFKLEVLRHQQRGGHVL